MSLLERSTAVLERRADGVRPHPPLEGMIASIADEITRHLSPAAG